MGFDAMLANPPYINAWAMHEHANEARQFLTEQSEGKLVKHWDLSTAFLIQAHAFAPSSAFVLPVGILTQQHGAPVRALLRDTQSSIVDWTGHSWFDGAAVDVFVASHTPHAEGHAQLHLGEKVLSDPVPIQDVFEALDGELRYVTDPVPFVTTLREASDPLGCHLYLNYGAQVSPKEKGGSKDDNIHHSPDACTSPQRYAEAKHINTEADITLEVNETFWLDYVPSALYGPRVPELFASQKLVIMCISQGRVPVWLDGSGLFMNHSVVLGVPHAALPSRFAKTFGFETQSTYSLEQLHLLMQNTYSQEHFQRHLKEGLNNYPKSVRQFLIPRVDPADLDEVLSSPPEHRQAGIDALVAACLGL